MSACWDITQCNEERCPSFLSEEGYCWLRAGTRQRDQARAGFHAKLEHCLVCDVFRSHANADDAGWMGFLVKQVRAYCEDVLRRAYQREERFFQILDRLPDGLFTIDSEWKITYMNPAAELITGFSAYDAVGMFCKDVFKNTVCLTDCPVKHAGVTGQNISNREYTIRNAFGQEIPVICSTAVLRGDDNEILGGIEVFKDITERKRLEDERIASEKKYRRIFEGSQDMIYLNSRSGKLLDINPAGVRMLGYSSKAELLALQSVAKLYLNPSDPRKFRDIIERQGFAKDFETELVRKDGRPITVLLTGNAVFDANGRLELIEGLAKDITQRKAAEKKLRQRNRELQFLNNISLTMNLTMNLDAILQFSLENVLNMLGLRRGGVYLIDRDSGGAVLRAQVGLNSDLVGRKGRIRLRDDRLMNALFRENTSFAPKPRFPVFRANVKVDGEKSVDFHCFLITVKDLATGFFALEPPADREFSIEEKDLMGSVGNFLGGAVENTQLMNAVKRHREELQRLTGELFHSQDMERKRIARELHDEAGQALTGINLSLESVMRMIPEGSDGVREAIRETRKQVNRTYQDIRRMSHRLHPSMLTDLGLKPTLNDMFDYVCSHFGLQIEFNMVGFDSRLDPEVETALYRFSQEALNNTLKHSGAENFKLSLVRSYPHIIFIAEDDGMGFDPLTIGEGKAGLGLLGMRERAALVNGKFQLKAVPGKGTRIRIEIPIEEMN